LSVLSLKKNFGKKEAVRGVDFKMYPGEVVGFLGPNGAGKTTCFYMIVGFIRPSSGNIYIGKTDITNKQMHKRANMGIAYLPQETSIFKKLSVEDNIYAVLETRDKLNKKQKKEKLEELLEELGIQDRRKQKAFTLSGGERRRTEIARSLAIEPKYLLLDEPFAGIDPIAVNEIKTIILNLMKKKIGILITDHNVRDTLEITNRSYIIRQGKILITGSRDEIIKDKKAKEIYLGKNFQM